MTFAEKLKTFRKRMNLSQEKMADKIGVSRQAITKWESGVGIPDIENLIAISKLFDVSIDELLSNKRSQQKIKEFLFESITEYDIAITKHYDIKLGVAREVYITGYEGEKIIIRLVSNTIESLQKDYKVTIDDVKKRIDVNVKTQKGISDVIAKDGLTIHVLLPNNYMKKVECEVVAENIHLNSLECEDLELDIKSNHIFIDDIKGIVEINCNLDMNIECHGLQGGIEINQVSATSKIVVPFNWQFSVLKKGIRTKIFYENNGKSVDAFNHLDADNYIEFNGINSELIISSSQSEG